MNLSYYITGAVTVFVPWESATPFLDLCLVRGAVYTDFLASEEGISLTLRLSPSRGLLREAEARGISFEVVKRRGIPVLFSRYRFRFGIPLGILLATLLVFFAGRVVWDIRIEGNERISSAAVRQLLADQGVRVGSYILDLGQRGGKRGGGTDPRKRGAGGTGEIDPACQSGGEEGGACGGGQDLSRKGDGVGGEGCGEG